MLHHQVLHLVGQTKDSACLNEPPGCSTKRSVLKMILTLGKTPNGAKSLKEGLLKQIKYKTKIGENTVAIL